MRLLAIADVVDPALDESSGGRWSLPAVDAVVSCGDLPGDYLTFLADQFACPLFYVRGNHDGSYDLEPPLRCVSIDGRLLRWRGLRMLGLGGAPPHNGGTVQYSEGAMRFRVTQRRFGVWRLGGLDLVVTHAGPSFADAPFSRRGHDPGAVIPSRDPPDSGLFDPGHRGFRALGELVHRYHPTVLLHGHTHLPYGADGRERTVDGTRVINAYGHCLIDLSPARASGRRQRR